MVNTEPSYQKGTHLHDIRLLLSIMTQSNVCGGNLKCLVVNCRLGVPIMGVVTSLFPRCFTSFLNDSHRVVNCGVFMVFDFQVV